MSLRLALHRPSAGPASGSSAPREPPCWFPVLLHVGSAAFFSPVSSADLVSMKRPFLFLMATLAANAVLLGVYMNDKPSSDADDGASGDKVGAPPAKVAGTSSTDGGLVLNAGIWSTLATADLHTLAARLRAAGFPESLVRAAIAASAEERLRPRLDAIEAMPAKPFWEPDRWAYGTPDATTRSALREYKRERSQLLQEALGDDLLADEAHALRRAYGNLPTVKLAQIQRITTDYDERRDEYIKAAAGPFLPEDRDRLSQIEAERRAEVARVLSPAEMEDFLVRTSITTTRLRTNLTVMEASPEEARAIYEAEAAHDAKIGSLRPPYNADEINAYEETRGAAGAQVTADLRAVLGEQRYADYLRAGSFEFQSLNRIVQRLNLPPDAAGKLFDLRENVAAESRRIFDEEAMALDQKHAALQTLAKSARTQITSMLGEEAGRTYIEIADRWISAVEGGGAITLRQNGMGMRGLPMPRPAAAGRGSARPTPPGTSNP